MASMANSSSITGGGLGVLEELASFKELTLVDKIDFGCGIEYGKGSGHKWMIIGPYGISISSILGSPGTNYLGEGPKEVQMVSCVGN